MSQVVKLREEAVVLIAQLDQVLATVRAYWLEASPNSKERRHWLGRINQLLDQRLHLMKVRDA